MLKILVSYYFSCRPIDAVANGVRDMARRFFEGELKKRFLEAMARTTP
ncbi:hypothetical protein [Paraburkholderia pallida]|nr:hypothetical protein [Paraburkholderia pallida]